MLENGIVEQSQSIEGMISPEEHRDGVSGGSYLIFHGKMGEKAFVMSSSHIYWMLFVVEENVALDPPEVAFSVRNE